MICIIRKFNLFIEEQIINIQSILMINMLLHIMVSKYLILDISVLENYSIT